MMPMAAKKAAATERGVSLHFIPAFNRHSAFDFVRL
jgi:hypothetical protein